MTCHVSNQIAEYCDEPEQLSAWELYQYLKKNSFVYINREFYSYDDITELLDYIDPDVMTDDFIIELYIDKIAELMDD